MYKREFAAAVERLAPPELAFDWDNCGFNVLLHDEIKKALICVDVTSAVIDEALALGCDTILSHHPLLFHAIKRVDNENPVDALLVSLIKNDLNHFAAHTSFDCAKGGINDALAQSFGIRNAQTLVPEESCGAVGELPEPLSRADFARLVKQTLGIDAVKCTDGPQIISRVAFLGGSGGEYWRAAAEKGAQALVTGEAKHSDFIAAGERGIMLVAAGHYDTEHCFTETMYKGLQNAVDGIQYNIEFCASRAERCPYRIV